MVVEYHNSEQNQISFTEFQSQTRWHGAEHFWQVLCDIAYQCVVKEMQP